MNTNNRPGETDGYKLKVVISDVCTYDKQTPDSSQECNSELTFEILPDEDDDTEVGIETITDEEGREHQEPGH